MTEEVNEETYLHEPVMMEEVLSLLRPEESPTGLFVDGTTSTGGHAGEIAARLAPAGTLVGLDLDRKGLQLARDRLADLPPNVELYRANFRDMDRALEQLDRGKADGILLDLGFSSFQLEDSDRGFSFQKDGPLDMRMDPDAELTAADIVNDYSFTELKRILLEYGEEGWADAIAGTIVSHREEGRIERTGQLVEIIEAAVPDGVKGRSKIHPATRSFQALRIAVNDEMTNLEEGLEVGFDCLKRGGVMVVISYHSLEDRRVKRFFRHKEKDCICPPDLPVCRCDKVKEVSLLTDGAVRPSPEEVKRNYRARSARLRAVERLTES